MKQTKLNPYRLMWILCCFDLPVTTAAERKAATQFRKFLIKNGFAMVQYSVYARHCPSMDNAIVHIKRIKRHVPMNGSVFITRLTDKQFGQSIIYHNADRQKPMEGWKQLELF